MKRTCILLASMLAIVASADAGARDSLLCRVTYVTRAQIYFEGGREEGLSPGDTLFISRGDTAVGSARITGTAAHSSVAEPLSISVPVLVGDLGVVFGKSRPPAVETPKGESPATAARPVSAPPSPSGPEPNALHGRVGIQYIGQQAEDSRLNLSQPALSARLRMENLAGTGLALSLSGRAYHDGGSSWLRYGDSVRTRVDVTEFSLAYDREGEIAGFSAGRFIPRYASSAGALDGGEVYIRQGQFTAGVLTGTGVLSRVSGMGGNQKSLGGFLAFQGGDPFAPVYSTSAAFLRQTVDGNVDREFVALQGSFVPDREFSAYASANVELKQMTGGTISSRPFLSSITVFAHYLPATWLSTNFGYDGTRSVYLFESMKSIPDSLFRRSMDQGFRLNGSARLGYVWTLTAEAGYSSSSADGGSSRVLGAGVRLSDMLSTRMYGVLRYRNLGGSFVSGSQTSAELGRNFRGTFDLLLEYSSRSYTVDRLKQTYTAQTFGGTVNLWISSHILGTVRGDYTIDNTMNGMQYFLECGYRF